MVRFSWTVGDERRALERDFEPDGDGYIFYRHHGSPGIPVTAEEREEYLSMPVIGSRQDFYDRIAGRAPVRPRRPYGRAYLGTLDSLPRGFVVSFLAAGALLLFSALRAEAPLLKWLWLVAGAMSALFGLQLLAVRLWRGRSR